MPQLTAYPTVWKIGPEWVAQQKKLVSISTMNGGDLSAVLTDIAATGSPPDVTTCSSSSSAGGRRTKSASGIMVTAAMPAMTSIENRQL
jgi:hypothetical protein